MPCRTLLLETIRAWPRNLIDLSGLNEVPGGPSDIDPSELEEVYWTRLVRWIARACWALATGDAELQRPVIRLGVLNPKYRNRTVDISDVTQPWLVQLATLHIRHVAALGKGATKIAEGGQLIRWWSAYLRTLGDLPPAKIMSEDACDGFARWLQRRVMDSTQYLKLEGLDGRAAAVAQTERDKITDRLIPPHPNSRASGKQVLLMTATNRGNFLRQLNMILLTHMDYLRELGGHAPGWRRRTRRTQRRPVRRQHRDRLLGRPRPARTLARRHRRMDTHTSGPARR